MTYAINLGLQVPGGAGITLRENESWECFSDPKSVFPEKNGTWTYSLSSGGQTMLRGKSGVTFCTLAPLKFSSAKKGDEGAVVGLEGVDFSVGSYIVTQVVE